MTDTTKKTRTKKTAAAKKVAARVKAVEKDALAALPDPKTAAAEIVAEKKEPNHKKEPKVSKMSICALIFEEEFIKEDHKRKDCIARFMAEASLTKAGASTYYQSLKTRHFEDEL